MYLFLTDETNTAQSDSVTFFIYGGVIIAMDKAAEVADGVTNIRRTRGYPTGSQFKFNTSSRPAHISKEQFAQAKSDILTLAHKTGVRFMACVVHHKISEKLAPGVRPLFPLKTLLCEYDLFLKRERTSGICSVD